MAPSFPIDFSGQRESRKCSQTGIHQVMGKSRKVSKGYSSGFVPDYRHAVETMAESEGFGSSGRLETEITASGDSCAPQRKCMSLNVDSYDRFGVPITVLSLSKMSESERKDLEVRLKQELQQIRAFQKKITAMGSNVTDTSPASDIHSCSDGQRRPFAGASKKHAAPPARNGSGLKRPIGRVEQPKKATFPPQGSTNAMIMKQCEALLNRLMQHQFSWVFNTPVNVVELNIPDYHTVIKHPMDLGTVKLKLKAGEYMNALSFASDVRLTFKNAMTYNPKGNDVHIMAEQLSKYFEVRWKPIEKKLPSNVYSPTTKSGDLESLVPPAKRTKFTPSKDIGRQELQPAKRVMSVAEKVKLSSELESLLSELPESIIDFLKESSVSEGQEEEIEIDIDALSDDTLLKLRKLLDDFIASKQKNQAKPCEIEVQNESGFSNSSMQPSKVGNETNDEDVDIGGDDLLLPITSFPSVEIEKDTTAATANATNANTNTNNNSSSSSSSDSGSSSSDSDSGSSSGSESAGAKPSAQVNNAKENLDVGANIENKKNNGGDNTAANSLNQVEVESQSKPVESGVGHQEVENAPCERQVSPDKLYRAAVMRNRFADTILKAQEKTLPKDEKLDPERLRLEKEELERRRREEKARLQAAAKAAEEAKKKAEAEAVAEAKRKREAEREAARLALQKMEKTVEINENCQFLDLEMLRVNQPTASAALDGNMAEVVDDASGGGLDDECNDLGFKFQGSGNPLEQLGLFMKADDDDEDVDITDQTSPSPQPQEAELEHAENQGQEQARNQEQVDDVIDEAEEGQIQNQEQVDDVIIDEAEEGQIQIQEQVDDVIIDEAEEGQIQNQEHVDDVVIEEAEEVQIQNQEHVDVVIDEAEEVQIQNQEHDDVVIDEAEEGQIQNQEDVDDVVIDEAEDGQIQNQEHVDDVVIEEAEEVQIQNQEHVDDVVIDESEEVQIQNQEHVDDVIIDEAKEGLVQNQEQVDVIIARAEEGQIQNQEQVEDVVIDEAEEGHTQNQERVDDVVIGEAEEGHIQNQEQVDDVVIDEAEEGHIQSREQVGDEIHNAEEGQID